MDDDVSEANTQALLSDIEIPTASVEVSDASKDPVSNSGLCSVPGRDSVSSSCYLALVTQFSLQNILRMRC